MASARTEISFGFIFFLGLLAPKLCFCCFVITRRKMSADQEKHDDASSSCKRTVSLPVPKVLTFFVLFFCLFWRTSLCVLYSEWTDEDPCFYSILLAQFTILKLIQLYCGLVFGGFQLLWWLVELIIF